MADLSDQSDDSADYGDEEEEVSGLHSYEYDDDGSSVDTEYTDNLHSSDEDDEYTGSDEDDPEDVVISRVPPANQRNPRNFGHFSAAATGANMRQRRGSQEHLLRKRIPDEPPQVYAPERWPPILDFVFVFSSFLAAVVAAYFTIF